MSATFNHLRQVLDEVGFSYNVDHEIYPERELLYIEDRILSGGRTLGVEAIDSSKIVKLLMPVIGMELNHPQQDSVLQILEEQSGVVQWRYKPETAVILATVDVSPKDTELSFQELYEYIAILRQDVARLSVRLFFALNPEARSGRLEDEISISNAASIDLVVEFLAAVGQCQGNYQAMSSILQARQWYLDEQLLPALRVVSRNYFDNYPEHQVSIALHINDFCLSLQNFPWNEAVNLETVIGGYEIALSILSPEVSSSKWALIQVNLGNAYIKRVQGTRGENIERAIECYESVLGMYGREASPLQWASMRSVLGDAYSMRINGDQVENLEQAVESSHGYIPRPLGR